MGFEQDNGHNTPFKLSLFSVPTQTAEPADTLATPLRTLASVPFQWEEAPGKPRSPAEGATKPMAERSLDLPPRLAKITKTPSPTAVLDGPYGSQRLPRQKSVSLRKGPFWSFQRDVGGVEKRGLGSWGCGSYRESSGEQKGIFDFSYSVSGEPTPSEGDLSKAQIAKVRKRGSFFGSSKSQTWASVCENIKQAVHRRRRQ